MWRLLKCERAYSSLVDGVGQEQSFRDVNALSPVKCRNNPGSCLHARSTCETQHSFGGMESGVSWAPGSPVCHIDRAT